MKKTLILLVTGFVAFGGTPPFGGGWLLVTPLFAQEKESLVVNADQVEYFQHEKKIVGEGNVSIVYKDMKLTCEKIEVFTQTKDAIASGNVKLYQDGAVFKGDKMYYNFESRRGEIIDVTMQGIGPWFGRGEYAAQTGDNRYDIKNAYITTCDREKPHYRIRSNKIKIFFDDKVVAHNVVFVVGKIPLFYLPYWSHPLKGDYPSVAFIPGFSKKWGFYMLTSWRYDLSEETSDAFKLEGGNLRLDYRQKKGFAHGIDQDYSIKGFGRGRLRYYYMQERDKEPPADLRTETQRYRVQLKHRWKMSDNTLAMLEYHRLSDRDFLKDYYYREEYEKEPQPKSYLSVISSHPNYTFSALMQKRTNRFFTETERLPELKVDFRNQRIKESKFYYKSDYSFANLTNKNADSDIDDDVVRLDTYNQLSYVTELGILNLTPYIGTRQTYYSKDKFGDEQVFRGIFYSGLDLSTKFHKIYDVNSDIWNLDINQLRHVVTPIINYRYIHRPTISPGKLMKFDATDSIDAKNTATIGIENKLQTKRKVKDELQTVDLGVLLFTGDYNFNNNLGNPWSDFKIDLELTPYSWLRFDSDVTYDPPSRDFKTANFDFVASGNDRWSVGIGSRYKKNAFNELTTQFTYNPSPYWKFRAFQRYAFERIVDARTKRVNDFIEQEYAIVRDLHCWTGEFALNIKEGYSFWVIFRLKAFPEVPFRLSTSYSPPRSTTR